MIGLSGRGEPAQGKAPDAGGRLPVGRHGARRQAA